MPGIYTAFVMLLQSSTECLPCTRFGIFVRREQFPTCIFIPDIYLTQCLTQNRRLVDVFKLNQINIYLITIIRHSYIIHYRVTEEETITFAQGEKGDGNQGSTVPRTNKHMKRHSLSLIEKFPLKYTEIKMPFHSKDQQNIKY